jgi:hypothetical protein
MNLSKDSGSLSGTPVNKNGKGEKDGKLKWR